MRDLTLEPGRLMLDGEASVLLCASVFPFRLPPETWADRLAAVRASGYRMVDLYVPWSHHETQDGRIDLSSPGRDLPRFLRLCQQTDLLVMARPGPYICSETDGGALPPRLLGTDGPLRCADGGFLAQVERWYAAVMPILAEHQTGRGGAVALLQVDNELDFFDCPDPGAYAGALADLARTYGITVPIIVCAGQGDLDGAGARADGVVPTLNFYPDDSSLDFDVEVRRYHAELSRRSLPLLVTETNRRHVTLRREVLAGARLVAPYLQVSGFNHDVLPSVGNWGDPANLMTHDYDFGGYLAADGARRAEYAEAVRLTRTLAAWGEALASAVPVGLSTALAELGGLIELPGPHHAGGALRLPDGGFVLGPAAVADLGSGQPLPVVVRTGEGEETTVRLPDGTCPLWCADVPLDRWGAPGRIILACAELAEVSPAAGGPTLVFEGGADAVVVLETPGGEVSLTGYGLARADGVSVRIRPPFETETDELPPGTPLPLRTQALTSPTPPWTTAPAPDAQDRSAPSLEDLGLRDGRAHYRTRLRQGARSLLLLGAGDLVRVEVDGDPGITQVPFGAPLEVPLDPAHPHDVTVHVQLWGHSNFDDARLPLTALASPRGTGLVLAVTGALDLGGLWSVVAPPDGRSRSVPPVRPLGGWSSTRLGEPTTYRRRVTVPGGGAERGVLLLRGLRREVRVEARAGAQAVRALLTPFSPALALPRGASDVELTVHAPHVAGGLVDGVALLHGHEPLDWRLRRLEAGALAEGLLGAATGTLRPAPSSGILVRSGAPVLARARLHLPQGAGAWLRLEGSGLLVTVLARTPDGPRRVSRHALSGVATGGGDPRRSWIPASWMPDGRAEVLLVLEALDAPQGLLHGVEWSPARS